jgi:signal transduction histidine kinase
MGRPFGLGLRSQLMLALVVAFGADPGSEPAHSVEASEADAAPAPQPSQGDSPRRTLFLFYLGLTAATVLLLTYVLLTYFIVRPIDRLRLASERLASGSLRTEVPVQGAAEVARLAATFNEMAAQLRQDRAALQERLEQLERTTAELTTAQEQLVRSARLAAVGRLSAGVAHEIGNPLAAIRGLLDLMELGDLGPDEEREFIARIQRETERIHRTIRDLLDFSRDEPGDHVDRVESSADLGEVVSDTVKLVDRQTRFRDIDLTLRLVDGLPRVKGDHERLRQLMLNLLFNAADALGGRGRIEVRAEQGGNAVLLTIEDDGPGIDEAILDQVFDPFVTTKPAGQGTGLGLAVCYTIAERLGGSIEAGNQVAGGAVFKVTLPVAR